MYAFRKIIPLLKASWVSSKFEEDIMMIQGALGVLAILPFAVSRGLQGEWVMVVLDLLIILGIVSLGVYGRNGANFRTVSTLFTLMYTSGMLAVISVKGPDMLFWAYPTAIGGYFMVRLNIANSISVLSATAITVLVYEELSGFQLSGFVVTYLLVCLFSYFFAARMTQDKQRLAEQATIDPLTGANNRRALDDAIESRVSLFSRRAAPVSIVIIDIDYFKRINDEHGHAVGDLFLQRFVAFLNGVVRQSEMLFRFGGVEFVVIAEGRLAEASNLSEKIRGLFEQTELIPDHPVTVSIGVAELGDAETSREWMKRADDALYLAKSLGRNRVCLAPALESKQKKVSTEGRAAAHKEHVF
jgi:diguanylate cyclase (GGDEF)-like protein